MKIQPAFFSAFNITPGNSLSIHAEMDSNNDSLLLLPTNSTDISTIEVSISLTLSEDSDVMLLLVKSYGNKIASLKLRFMLDDEAAEISTFVVSKINKEMTYLFSNIATDNNKELTILDKSFDDIKKELAIADYAKQLVLAFMEWIKENNNELLQCYKDTFATSALENARKAKVIYDNKVEVVKKCKEKLSKVTTEEAESIHSNLSHYFLNP